MTIASPRQFNNALCTALGLDGHKVRAIALETAVDQAPVLVVEMYATEEQADRFVALVKLYRLVPLEEDTPT